MEEKASIDPIEHWIKALQSSPLKAVQAIKSMPSNIEEGKTEEMKSVLNALENHYYSLDVSTIQNPADSLIPIKNIFTFDSADITRNIYASVTLKDLIEVSSKRAIILLTFGGHLYVRNSLFDGEYKFLHLNYSAWRKLAEGKKLSIGDYIIYSPQDYRYFKDLTEDNWSYYLSDTVVNHPDFKTWASEKQAYYHQISNNAALRSLDPESMIRQHEDFWISPENDRTGVNFLKELRKNLLKDSATIHHLDIKVIYLFRLSREPGIYTMSRIDLQLKGGKIATAHKQFEPENFIQLWTDDFSKIPGGISYRKVQLLLSQRQAAPPLPQSYKPQIFWNPRSGVSLQPSSEEKQNRLSSPASSTYHC